MSFEFPDSSFFSKFRLPSHDEIFSLSEKMCDVLENEKKIWRPQDKNGDPGSLLDFTFIKEDVPVVFIPDLHARPLFLRNILFYDGLNLTGESGKRIVDLLCEKKIHLVFLGDALHSEKTTRERWQNAFEDFLEKNFTGNAMTEEMEAGLTLLMQLYELKIMFPDCFHFLKGNHENILNEEGGGDFPFRKYADEGRMVKAFMSNYYGDDVLYMISWCEKKLPLVYAGKNCTASHAEPARTFSRDEIINARFLDEVVEGLVWTANDTAQDGSVIETIKKLSSGKPWFTGHRPVREDYSFRQNGNLIQIHNPIKQSVFCVNNSSINSFNPLKDIHSVIKNESGGLHE